jgi:hypothetical protein
MIPNLPQFPPKGSIMSTFKHSLHVKSNNVVKSGLCFISLTLIMVISPAINPFQKVQAAQALIDANFSAAAIPQEVIDDWMDQDKVSGTAYASATTSIVGKLPAKYATMYDAAKASVTGDKNLYLLACHYRRVSKMQPFESDLQNIIFAKHHNFGGILVGYHDNSDAGNSDMCWSAQSALCVLNLKNYYSTFTEILTKTDAVVRDPCISFDGKKVLFAMSGKSKGTGYKIYEMEIATKTLKQLTSDPGNGLPTVADFEPCYLPNGDIMFTSTRNFGLVDCATNPTTNMFLMNGAGKYMHQIGFDQVNTFYPVLLEDGSVLYTRWEYNDRDITNTMGLFYMYPDGAHQTEWFGNQNGWPYSILHGRGIPGTSNAKVIAVGGGHHGPYCGELLIIDRSLGTNGAQSISMIAPKRATKPNVNKSDISMGNADFRWQYPFPLDETNFLVSWRKSEMKSGGSGGMGSTFDGIFRLYFMNVDGNRELLAWADQSVGQPVSMKPREKIPPKVAVQANYNDSIGEFTMQDVSQGDGLKGIAKGVAKRLRVVKLHYRVAGGAVGTTVGNGPAGSFAPAIFCPISQYGASWEAKEVLGEAPIYPDGSASFQVPARVPVYFQVLDSMGYCIASMRSWSTLMPGEKFACVGCHENKITSPSPTGSGQAGIPKPLEKPLGIENKPFDYKQMVQPIFDKNCASCHKAGHTSGFDLTGDLSVSSASKKWTKSYSSLLSGIGSKSSNGAVNICYMFSQPPQQKPYSFGSSQSGIMTKALNGANASMNKLLTQTEKNIIACWIDLCSPHAGKYNSYMSASDSTGIENKFNNRKKWAAIEAQNLKELALLTAVMPNDHGTIKGARFTEQLRIGYASAKRALVLRDISQGNLKVLDLQGRVLYRMKLSHPHPDGDVIISLPARLSIGLYLAQFEGVKGIRQAKISITE